MLGWEVIDTVRVYTKYGRVWERVEGVLGMGGDFVYTHRTATTTAELLRGGGVMGGGGGGEEGRDGEGTVHIYSVNQENVRQFCKLGNVRHTENGELVVLQTAATERATRDNPANTPTVVNKERNEIGRQARSTPCGFESKSAYKVNRNHKRPGRRTRGLTN